MKTQTMKAMAESAERSVAMKSQLVLLATFIISASILFVATRFTSRDFFLLDPNSIGIAAAASSICVMLVLYYFAKRRVTLTLGSVERPSKTKLDESVSSASVGLGERTPQLSSTLRNLQLRIDMLISEIEVDCGPVGVSARYVNSLAQTVARELDRCELHMSDENLDEAKRLRKMIGGIKSYLRTNLARPLVDVLAADSSFMGRFTADMLLTPPSYGREATSRILLHIRPLLAQLKEVEIAIEAIERKESEPTKG